MAIIECNVRAKVAFLSHFIKIKWTLLVALYFPPVSDGRRGQGRCETQRRKNAYLLHHCIDITIKIRIGMQRIITQYCKLDSNSSALYLTEMKNARRVSRAKNK